MRYAITLWSVPLVYGARATIGRGEIVGIHSVGTTYYNVNLWTLEEVDSYGTLLNKPDVTVEVVTSSSYISEDLLPEPIGTIVDPKNQLAYHLLKVIP